MQEAEARARFEIEYASEPALRALGLLVEKEQLFMAWTLGYLKGAIHGIDMVKEAMR